LISSIWALGDALSLVKKKQIFTRGAVRAGVAGIASLARVVAGAALAYIFKVPFGALLEAGSIQKIESVDAFRT
jgi:hypothetical protein